jgi:membrane associated rhomboid family serine protease
LFTYVGPAFGAVAWWTHIAGFVIGILFALVSKPALARRLRG